MLADTKQISRATVLNRRDMIAASADRFLQLLPRLPGLPSVTTVAVGRRTDGARRVGARLPYQYAAPRWRVAISDGRAVAGNRESHKQIKENRESRHNLACVRP